MGESGKSGEVDKLVSDFLSELNALSESLARTKPEPPSERAEPDPGQVCAVAPDSAPQAAITPAAEEQPSEAAPSNPVHYRNIDILLMDDAKAAPPPKKRAEHDDDLLQSCRPLYRSRFYAARRRRHIVMGATASVLLLCVAGTLYVLRPLGRNLGRAGAGAPSAETGPPPSAGIISPAVPVDKIVAAYPKRVRRLGSKAVVELDVEVDERGRAVRATPVSGPAQLRAAAARAVTRSRFKPAQRDGLNIKSTVRVSVPFKSNDK